MLMVLYVVMDRSPFCSPTGYSWLIPPSTLQGNFHATSAGGPGKCLLGGESETRSPTSAPSERGADWPHASADRAGQDGRTRPFSAVARALAGVSVLSHATRTDDRVDAMGRVYSRETHGESVDTRASSHARASS